MLAMPMRRSFFSVAGPTKNSSRTGSGHSFSAISQGNTVETPLGFFSSPAHLGEDLVGGNADADREPQFPEDPVRQPTAPASTGGP